MFYVAAYDCPSNKRRRKLMELMKDHLFHIQGSVFEGSLAPPVFRKLLADARKIVNSQEDSLRIYVLPEVSLKATIVIGRPALSRDRPVITITDSEEALEGLPF